MALDADSKSQSVLIIGTYRSNEIDHTHFLPTAIDIIRKNEIPYKDIPLLHLSREAISDMIKDTVRLVSIYDNFDMETLSEYVYSKTEGNAFFATHVLYPFSCSNSLMLQTLYDQGDLQFDFERRKWNFKVSDADVLPANVVDLIVRGLKRLPPETQAVLKLAACIGSNRFTLFLLSIVYQRSLEETAADLWPALQAGFVVPTSNAYQIPLAIEPGSELSQQWMNTNTSFEDDNFLQDGFDRDSDGSSTSTNNKHKGVVVIYRSSLIKFI